MLYEKMAEKRVNAYLFNGFHTGPQGDDIPIFETVDNLLLKTIFAGRIAKSGTDLKVVQPDDTFMVVPARHYIVIGMDGVITILTPSQLHNNYRPINKGQI